MKRQHGHQVHYGDIIQVDIICLLFLELIFPLYSFPSRRKYFCIILCSCAMFSLENIFMLAQVKEVFVTKIICSYAFAFFLHFCQFWVKFYNKLKFLKLCGFVWNKVSLQDYNAKHAQFRVLPRYKVKAEGDNVCESVLKVMFLFL